MTCIKNTLCYHDSYLTCTITKIGKIVFYSQVCYFFPFSFIYGQGEEEKNTGTFKVRYGLTQKKQFKLTDISNELSTAPAINWVYNKYPTQKF
jgi:hypothetical protein